MISYSIVLSTLGNRSTLPNCLTNFNSFIESRNDIELIVATSNPDFNPTVKRGKVIHVNWNKPEMYFMWRHGADNSTGDWVVMMGDDSLLSRNFFDRCDRLSKPDTLIFQPTLLDPQGYVVCGEYFRSYDMAAVRRSAVSEYNLGTEPDCLTKFVDSIWHARPERFIFDTGSFLYHYGYEIEGGIPPVIAKWDAATWIKQQREKFNYRRINVKDTFIF
jgi:hypothetical protein